MKLSIIIPVYNEVATVRELLVRVSEQAVPVDERELIVIESCSSDGTREVVTQFAEEANRKQPGLIKLILQEGPQGKGHAVQEGFAAATGDIILIQDGDLEYDTADYPALLGPILDGKTAFVLGSRHLAAGSWKIRRFEKDRFKSFLLNLGGIFFHGLFNFVYGQKLTDPTTMYKVFRRKCLDGLSFTANRFDFDYELLGKLIRKGYTPYEVPISYVSRGFKEGKKIRVFRDPFTWIRAILRYRFATLDPKAPINGGATVWGVSSGQNRKV